MIILSNASVIDAEQAKRLKELKVSQVEISLYAMDEGTQDTYEYSIQDKELEINVERRVSSLYIDV